MQKKIEFFHLIRNLPQRPAASRKPKAESRKQPYLLAVLAAESQPSFIIQQPKAS